MSEDREYSFESAVHFSWGSLSTLHVTVPQLKEMIRFTSQQSPLGQIVCDHGHPYNVLIRGSLKTLQ